MFNLDIPSGYILAIFFVIFDVLGLAITDVLLTRLVCGLYYRDISAGFSVQVRSIDIPGVVNYLVGNFFSLANLLTLFIKISMITIAFFINFNVNSTDGFQYFIERRKATYDFIPTDEEWGPGRARAVSRSSELSLNCRQFHGDNVTFYRSVFNLEDNVDLLNETDVPVAGMREITVNDSSIICLSPKFVSNHAVDPILMVRGCSTLGSVDCANSTEYQRAITAAPNENLSVSFDISYDLGSIGYGTTVFNSTDVAKGFPEYVNPNLICLAQCVGLQDECCQNAQSTNCRKIIKPCLIFAEDKEKNETLFERWTISNQVGDKVYLSRTHPGPILEGVFNFGLDRARVALINVHTSVSWWEYAGVLLTDSFVYRYTPRDYELKKASRPTFIPLETIVLGALFVLIVMIGCIAIRISIGEDERPRFNTVNGLSSILREENTPTGNSYREGKNALLGLVRNRSQRLHFGPVGTADAAITRSAGLAIE